MEQHSGLGNQQERREWWFGGFFDGEGCIAIVKGPNRGGTSQLTPQVRVVSSNPQSIEMIEAELKAKDVPYHFQMAGPSHIGSRNVARISINGMKRVKRFLEAFSKVIICKKPEADLVMRFIESRLKAGNNVRYSEAEFDIWVQLRNLHGYRTRVSPETTRKTLLGRYSPNSDRKTESAAEMPAPAA